MSDNKFIERLKGKDTSKSVLEINNEATRTSFANMPSGTSNAIDVYSDHRADATAVLNGTMNWKISNNNLILANDIAGDGADFSSTYSVSGAGLWINSVYTFPSTGDPAHPVAMVFNPSTKWVLKVCGDNLIVDGGYIADFTLLVKIGTSNIFTKTFSVAEQAGPFCKEFVLDFNETNAGIIKASGLTTLTVQLLCGTANASARIYNGMTVFTCLQRKVDASAVSTSFANVEEALQDGMLPSDYFNNAAFIDQVEDGEQAYAVFERDGDTIDLAGWTPKDAVAYKDEVIIKAEVMPTPNADLVGAIYQYTGVTSAPYEHGYIYECKETSPGVYGWERIDVQPGGSRGRFLALWNCATGLAESNPPISPYEYKTGDYFIVGAVSSATPAVNYKPDGTSYVIGTPSTTVETNEVAVDDTYFFDGTTWKLQSNSNKTVTFSNIAGDIYDNASATTALNAKQNTLVSGANIKTINSTSLLGSGNISITGLPTQTGQSGKYLTTDGSTASWATVDALPTQTGNNGKLLTTNGTSASWTEIKTINSGSLVGSGNIDVLVNEAIPASSLGVGYTTINTTYTDSVNIGNGAQVKANNALALGAFASAEGQDSIAIYSSTGTSHRARTTHTGNIAIGYNALAINAAYTIAIGYNAYAQGTNSIQLGTGNVALQNTFQVWTYPMLNKTTGLIPSARLADQTNATQGQALILDANLDGQWTTIATVATSGSYNDLLNKPTIPAAQVNADWNANSGVAEILNKPTLGTAAAADTTDFATAAQGALADTALQSGDNVSELVNDAGYLVMGDLTGFVTRTTAQTISGLKTFSADIALSGTTSIKNTTSGVSYTMLYRDTSGIHVGTSTQALLLAGSATNPSYNGNSIALTSDIPTVNNPTIIITQGGVTKGSFTLNQASSDTIALDAGGGGSVAIDNSTITKNGDDEIQAVATVNANTAAGATNPVYDWVGTLAEYTSQAVATNHPDWVCYITDDLTAQAYDAYSKSQSDTLLANKANIDLDNLSATGKSTGATLAMPSNTYVDLTLGASGTQYTAPADGYVAWSHSAGHFLASLDSNNVNLVCSWSNNSAIHIPVRKGQKFKTDYSSGTTDIFRFIYAQGEI